jgi:hypothetical protein
VVAVEQETVITTMELAAVVVLLQLVEMVQRLPAVQVALEL